MDGREAKTAADAVRWSVSKLKEKRKEKRGVISDVFARCVVSPFKFVSHSCSGEIGEATAAYAILATSST